MSLPKTKRVSIEAELKWYNPSATVFFGPGWEHAEAWEIRGKGFGELVDSDGNRYFVYGSELGGGLYGEDADPQFVEVGKKYRITNVWHDPAGEYAWFMMKNKLRAKCVRLLDGTKPSSEHAKKQEKRRYTPPKKRRA